LAAVSKGGWLAAADALDRSLYRVVNRGLGPRADAFFTGVTELGSIWASVGATLALSARGRRREALDALGAALAMWALGQVAKKAVLRPRPYQSVPEHRLLIQKPRGTSWPSSHPAVLLTYLTVVTRNLGAPATVRRATRALAWTVGLSRVYVGVHYPADVAGGMLMGKGVAALWQSVVSPRTVGSVRSAGAPGTVTP